MVCEYLEKIEKFRIEPKHFQLCIVGPRPSKPDRSDLSNFCEGDYTKCSKYILWG